MKKLWVLPILFCTLNLHADYQSGNYQGTYGQNPSSQNIYRQPSSSNYQGQDYSSQNQRSAYNPYSNPPQSNPQGAYSSQNPYASQGTYGSGQATSQGYSSQNPYASQRTYGAGQGTSQGYNTQNYGTQGTYGAGSTSQYSSQGTYSSNPSQLSYSADGASQNTYSNPQNAYGTSQTQPDFSATDHSYADKYPKDTYTTEADHDINARIRKRFSGWFGDSYKLIVLHTDRGNVIIEGFVLDNNDRNKLTDEIRNIMGVRGVNNNTQLKK